MQCQLPNTHRHIDAKSPLLRQGNNLNANRGFYKGRGEGKAVEEEGMRVGGIERDASLAKSGGKH